MKPLIGNSSLLSIHPTHRHILWNVLERYTPVGEESVLQLNSFPGGSAGKESACDARDLGSIPGFGRSPGKGNGSPLQYSGLEISTDCTIHGVAKSQTRLRDFHFHFIMESYINIGKINAFFNENTYDNYQDSNVIITLNALLRIYPSLYP